MILLSANDLFDYFRYHTNVHIKFVKAKNSEIKGKTEEKTNEKKKKNKPKQSTLKQDVTRGRTPLKLCESR
jgi:hypothetical protein